MTKLPADAAIPLLAAAALLITLAIQYPLSTTFPIGGDAASHIQAAKDILGGEQTILTLRTSNYPASQFIFAGFTALPATWPDRFVWWITLGHILVGVAIAVLLWRISSWPAAAAGLVIWALTPVGINTHFEDGTAPQLWSLVFLLLTFERLAAGSVWSTLAFAGAAVSAHFLTGAILIISLAMGSLMLLPVRRYLAFQQSRQIKYYAIVFALFALLTAFPLTRPFTIPFIEPQSEDFFVLDMLKSKFAPWLVLSLPGLSLMTRQLRRRLPAATSLLSFFWLSFLLTTNSSLHVGLWENRFRTYFIMSVSLSAGLALPALLRSAFRGPVLRFLFTSLLITTLAVLTWRDNAATYRYYEEPNNQTLPPDVRAALTWMKDNLAPTDALASTTATRYGEWIPILTPFRWQELPPNYPLFTTPGNELYTIARAQSFTHLILFLHHEDVPRAIAERPELFKVAFANPSAAIYQLP